jgi:hypothetical protein
MIVVAFALAVSVACQRTEQSETEEGQTSEELEGKAPETAPAAPSAAASSAPRSSQAAPSTRSVTLPAGTPLKIRTISTISTAASQVGDAFDATLEEPLKVGDWVIAPKGAELEGQVVEVDKGGRVKGVASIGVTLLHVHTPEAGDIDLPTNTVRFEAQSTKTKDATKIAIGTGIGAAIGAIAGGKKGAGIGAATGAGAGTGVVLATRGDAAEIPSESVIAFELISPVGVTAKK